MMKRRREKTKHSDNPGKGKTFNRDTVLQDLHDMLAAMSNKIIRGRIRDKQAFDLQLRALKAFSYGVSTFSNTLDATENEVILERLSVLEARDRGSSNND